MTDPCKGCGAPKCAGYEPCQCCGKCRNCGAAHAAILPQVPPFPVIPDPFIPWDPFPGRPWEITWGHSYGSNVINLPTVETVSFND